MVTGVLVASMEGYGHYLGVRNMRPGPTLDLLALWVAILGIAMTTAYHPRMSVCYLGNAIVAIISITPKVVVQLQGTKPGMGVVFLFFGVASRCVGGLLLSSLVMLMVRSYRVDEPDDENVCEYCGYSLMHLTVSRCPECGKPFDAEKAEMLGGVD